MLLPTGTKLPPTVCYAAFVADAPSPLALLLGAAFAAASGFALANLWIRHRRALARDRAHWAALAARRGWHLSERGGTFAVLGSTGLAFRLAALALQNLAPRLDPALDLPLGEQQWLLELWSCGDRLTHFQRLGLAPTRDPAAIRRAFLGTCQRLHPDRYYGKHIGRFARVLVDLFHRAHAAHACLADPRSCARYLTQLVDAGHTLPDEALAPRDDAELPLELQRRSA